MSLTVTCTIESIRNLSFHVSLSHSYTRIEWNIQEKKKLCAGIELSIRLTCFSYCHIIRFMYNPCLNKRQKISKQTATLPFRLTSEKWLKNVYTLGVSFLFPFFFFFYFSGLPTSNFSHMNVLTIWNEYEAFQLTKSTITYKGRILI